MGYESRIYVVRKTKTVYASDDGKHYANVVAMFDMSKCYPLSDVLRHKPDTDCYIYADDGNTKIVEDCYGKPLTEATIGEVVKLLEEVMKYHRYWMYNLLYASLKECEKFNSPINPLVVLHFGY